MKIILVPLDGSALAEHVLPYLPLLAAALDARVLLIEAVCELEFATAAGAVAGEVEVGVGREPRWEPQIGWDLRREHAASYLESHAARLRERGLEVATEVCAGAPAEVIVEVASRHRTALVAMATHGYTGLRRWARGSVANQVVQMCCVPVFLVRGAARPMGIGTRLRRILVPLDETSFARQALPIAFDLAAGSQAELIVMQVVAPSIEEFIGAAPAMLDLRASLRDQAIQAFAARFGERRAEQPPITPVVTIGSAAAAIVEEVTRRRADLIVMATSDLRGRRRWAYGSVADKLLHATTIPILLVRAE